MAEEVLQKIEQQLTCSICLEKYTDPKLLQCNHVHCKQCLVKLVDRDQQGKLGLPCPICREVTPIPDNGVMGLKPAFHINHLLEIRDAIHNFPSAQASAESGSGTILPNSIGCCPVHKDKVLELFCETCKELVCYKCVTKGGKHPSHYYEEIIETVEKCRELEVRSQEHEKYEEEIVSLLKPMEKQVEIVKGAQAKFESRCEEVANQQASIMEGVRNTFTKLRDVLTAREDFLASYLDQKTRNKLKNLQVGKDHVETTLAQLNSCLLLMKGSLQTPSSNKEEVIMDTVRQAKELLAPFPADLLEPKIEADMEFLASGDRDIAALCEKHGQVFESRSPDPSNCYVTGIMPRVMSMETRKAVLHIVNYGGKPCDECLESPDCEMESQITGKRESCSVVRNGHGQYEISYKPSFKGKHMLHVKVDGQQVRESPLTLEMKLPIQNLGRPLLTIRKLKLPTGITVNKEGQLLITESNYAGGRVSVYSPGGEKLQSFAIKPLDGMRGSAEGVAVDEEGNILVADDENHCIHKLTSEGQLLVTVGKRGEKSLQFRNPTDIVFSPISKKIYVTDKNNNRVQVLNTDFTFSSFFDLNISNDKDLLGECPYPCGIACDSSGKVYVAANKYHCIQIFTAKGEFLRNFEVHGQKLRRPYGIAFDASDRVYISDKNQVHVFTCDGYHVTSFGDSYFSEPQGLVVVNDIVYVCDDNSVVAY